MADDDEIQDSSIPLDDGDPLGTIERAMAQIQTDFSELASALEIGDRDRIQLAASDLVDAWLLVDATVELLDAPTAEARKQLRIARQALHTAGQVVDELFACALARAGDATDAFVGRIRAAVAFVLDRGDPPRDDGELS